MTEHAENAFAYERVAILGVGLIGSSVARAMRRAGMKSHIVAYDRPDVLKRAEAISLCDSYCPDVREAVKDADLVILATPVGTFSALAEEFATHLKDGATLSDVGSVKSAVIRDVGPYVPDKVHFIPAHPIAGTEESGPEAGFGELFEGRWCLMTPLPGTDREALGHLKAFWQAFGSKIDTMDAHHHDLVLAVTSHLPHLIAYNIVGTADDLTNVTHSEVIKYSASGFRDFTRIAASDPTMWRDIFLNNREAVLEMLGRFVEDLSALGRAIRWGEGDTLYQQFSRTRAIRRRIIDAGQESPVPNFGRDLKKKP